MLDSFKTKKTRYRKIAMNLMKLLILILHLLLKVFVIFETDMMSSNFFSDFFWETVFQNRSEH